MAHNRGLLLIHAAGFSRLGFGFWLMSVLALLLHFWFLGKLLQYFYIIKDCWTRFPADACPPSTSMKRPHSPPCSCPASPCFLTAQSHGSRALTDAGPANLPP